MKLYINFEKDESLTSFDYAKAFYESCKSGFIDVETVAKMMLLEAKNELERSNNNDK